MRSEEIVTVDNRLVPIAMDLVIEFRFVLALLEVAVSAVKSSEV